MKTNSLQRHLPKSALLIIASFLLFAVSAFSQERIDVYHHVPVTETRWMNASFNSIGVNAYPSAKLTRTTSSDTIKKNVPMYYFDLRMLTFSPDDYKAISFGLSLGYFLTKPEAGDQKFNGGDLNLCIYHLPKELYSNGLSMYGGVIAGAGIGTVTYFHGEASLGFIMPLDKEGKQALSLDGGYNFSNLKTGEWNLEPGFFIRIGFCFSRGSGYYTSTSYN